MQKFLTYTGQYLWLLDSQITTVSLVTQGSLVMQDLKDVLETKGSEELKVMCDYLYSLVDLISRDDDLLCVY